LRAFTQRLDNIDDDVPLAPPEALEFSDPARYGFHLLGLGYVITYCDKATANFAIVCKARAAAKLLEKLNIIGQQGNPNYTPAVGDLATPADHIAFFIAESQTVWNIPVPLAHRQLPYFACIPKIPKNPVGLRWLAIGRKCVLRLLQDRLTWLLKAMSPGLRVLWTRMQARVPADTCLRVDLPILPSSAHLIPLLVHFIRTRRTGVFAHIFTHDVTNCYTNIPQDDLVDKVTDWLQKVWDLHPTRAYHHWS
jgi:hypothetical protein